MRATLGGDDGLGGCRAAVMGCVVLFLVGSVLTRSSPRALSRSSASSVSSWCGPPVRSSPPRIVVATEQPVWARAASSRTSSTRASSQRSRPCYPLSCCPRKVRLGVCAPACAGEGWHRRWLASCRWPFPASLYSPLARPRRRAATRTSDGPPLWCAPVHAAHPPVPAACAGLRLCPPCVL